MKTVRLVLGYDGTDFSGSQVQPNKRTVEGELSALLQQLYTEQIQPIFSGRTDSGVHASGQVVSFPLRSGIPTNRLVSVLNKMLPVDIRVFSAEEISGFFDARRDAQHRTYWYWFSESVLPVTMSRYIVPLSATVDLNVFDLFRSQIVGTHNFVNFRNVGSNETSTIRTIFQCDFRPVVTQSWDGTPLRLWRFEVCANAFLFRMVRNLVGVLLALWQNSLNLSHLKEMLSGIDKGPFPFTVAEPRGLHLVNVTY